MLTTTKGYDTCPKCGECTVEFDATRTDTEEWDRQAYIAHCENPSCDWEGEVVFELSYLNHWTPESEEEREDWKANAPRL